MLLCDVLCSFTEGIYVLYSYKAAPSAGQAVQKFLSTPTASGVSNILRCVAAAVLQLVGRRS